MADMGGIGKASEEMIKELQKMQQDQTQDKSKGGEHAAKFEQVLQNHTQTPEAQNLAKVQEAAKPAHTLQAAKATQINHHLQAQLNKVGEAKKPGKSMMHTVLSELTAGQNKLEDMMKLAMGGRTLSNQELLGIQAGVYMYSQQMELASKVVEKATSGIKQTMNTQV